MLNGANEAAVAAFLDGKIPFLRIGELVGECCSSVAFSQSVTLSAIEEADREAREYVSERIKKG